MVTKSVLLLFDLDGTLTPPRQPMTVEMKEFLMSVSDKASIGIVTGSDFKKLNEQLNNDNQFINLIDYLFSENGLVSYKKGAEFFSRVTFFLNKHLPDELGEDYLKRLIGFILRYIADLDIPIKRGTFVEFRRSMINASPIGRSCSQIEREDFISLDAEKEILKKFALALENEFGTEKLKFSIGGQISVDIFPIGWDKSFCLTHIDSSKYSAIHFFGDKPSQGGNDYELFIHPSVIPHKVSGPEDTLFQVKNLLGLK